jgi:hypothetical protein
MANPAFQAVDCSGLTVEREEEEWKNVKGKLTEASTPGFKLDQRCFC